MAKNDANVTFSKNLIKGRIGEMVFEQMLRDAGCFTVLSFGYENTLPELMRKQNDIHAEETMEIIRCAPDFAVIDDETHDVYLIEVKYRRRFLATDVLNITKRMYGSWKPSYLFLATPDGFYFGQAHQIIKNEGKMEKVKPSFIPEILQKKYLDLMNKFITE